MDRLPALSLGYAQPGHRLAVGLLALGIVTAALAAACFGQVRLATTLGLLPAFDAAAVLVDLLTAALLFAQASAAQDARARRLGVAYAFSAIALACSGMIAARPLLGGADSAAWVWACWHGGFAICTLRALLGPPPPLRRGDMARTLARVTLAAVTLAGIGAVWQPAPEAGIGLAVAMLTAGACFAAIRRLWDPLSLWLAVSLLAASLEAALGGQARGTIGWYAAHGVSLLTGAAMLVALMAELAAQAGRVAASNVRLEQMLCLDALSGLHNRRSFETTLEQEWRRGHREQTALSMLMIDIDHFKAFNDRHGHPAGDSCLRRVGAAVAAQVQRPADMVARVGGEEFVVLLPGTEEEGAARVAERVRAAVAATGITHEEARLGRVTVSIGVATRRPCGDASERSTLVDAADRALYLAKESGRNLVRAEQLAGERLVAA